MPDEPDLTAELDEAEALVLHDATTETEWGVDVGTHVVHFGGSKGTAQSWVHSRARIGQHHALVRRTVTYGPWEEPADEQ